MELKEKIKVGEIITITQVKLGELSSYHIHISDGSLNIVNNKD